VSGKSVDNRPGLARAIDEFAKGDVLIVAELDRVTRSMNDGLRLIQRIADACSQL
jgi:DNA invertase Pin-like site-specific DNA recombinase